MNPDSEIRVTDSPAVAAVQKKKITWVGPLLKYGLAIGLLTLMISLNYSKLKVLFSQTPHLVPFAIAGGVYFVILGMQYIRWWVLVRAIGLPFRLRDAVRLGLVGTFYNTFLPGAVGGDIVKAIFIAKGQTERKAAAVATVVADRLLGLFGLLLFGSAVGGACWIAGDPKIEGNKSLQNLILICTGLAGSGLIGFVGLGFLPASRQDRFADRLKGIKKVGNTLAELWFTAVQFRQRPGAILLGVFLSAISHTAMIVSFHYAVRIFPPNDPALLGTLPEHFIIAPIGFIVQAIIPVPGGLGAGELSFGALYAMIRGKEGEAVGLAGRMSLRVVEWTLGLLGYIVFLSMKAELPKVEEEKVEGEIEKATH